MPEVETTAMFEEMIKYYKRKLSIQARFHPMFLGKTLYHFMVESTLQW